MTRAYFNQKAAFWDETVSERDMTKLERMSLQLNIEPASIVLDVGTGTGVLIPFLLKKIGGNGHLVALDIADKMLEKAKAKSSNGNINYLCADVTDIPFGDEIFDSIVCYSTFPHFRDKPRALAEMKRVIKTGGNLSICHTSNRTTINAIHSQIPEAKNDIIPNGDEMELMLLEAGFTDIRIDDNSESYLCSATKLTSR